MRRLICSTIMTTIWCSLPMMAVNAADGLRSPKNIPFESVGYELPRRDDDDDKQLRRLNKKKQMQKLKKTTTAITASSNSNDGSSGVVGDADAASYHHYFKPSDDLNEGDEEIEEASVIIQSHMSMPLEDQDPDTTNHNHTHTDRAAPDTTNTDRTTNTDPFLFYGFLGEHFLYYTSKYEASGIDVSPDGSHLIIVSDNGKVVFLNLLDYSRGHCGVDLGNNPDIRKRLDFEGVAIDRTIWSPDNMQAYIVYEGSSEDEPLLFKIRYTYDSSVGSCSVAVGDTVSLFHALPCLPGSNGIESLTWKETNRNGVATFFVGVQDTGKLYEVTSEGKSNGGRCYDRGLGMTDLSASSYDGKYLWSFYGERGELTVIDPSRENCQLPVYNVFSPTWDKEGIVIDFQRGNMYVAVDEGEDDPSFVAVYNFTYPTNLEDDVVCVGKKRYQTCSGFLNCSDTYYPTWSPTSFPTYILQG